MSEQQSNGKPQTLTVVVIGNGAFGTAMAMVAARNDHNVIVFARNNDIVAGINDKHRNPSYFSDIDLPANLTATSDVESALASADLVILALPCQIIPGWLEEHKGFIREDVLLCNTAKGLYVKDGCLLSEAIERALGRQQPYALLSGPSFAKEIMLEHPTSVVVASKFLYHAVTVQRAMSSGLFRCYTSQDLIGVELGGALKNPLAIGAGMIEGQGMGINTMAAYVTRSSLELMQLCKAMGGQPQTISGLSGIGDLMLTAFGDLSRNRTMGLRLTKGESVQDICKSMTVEGVPTAAVAVKFADACGLELPLFRAVAAVLDGSMSIPDVRSSLQSRPVNQETPNLYG